VATGPAGRDLDRAQPIIQTFGENIGRITSEVFELTSNETDYHSVLVKLAERYSTLEEIESLFDGELSMQARAFIMAALARKVRSS
jgi:hypothetical protein